MFSSRNTGSALLLNRTSHVFSHLILKKTHEKGLILPEVKCYSHSQKSYVNVLVGLQSILLMW